MKMALTNDPALEPSAQFNYGFTPNDRVGIYNAPATAQVAGTPVKLGAAATDLEVCGDNDAGYILQQSCALNSPIGSAANRELWLQAIPQAAVECGAKITAYPIMSGSIMWTSVLASGSDVGAVTAGAVTPGTTEFAAFGGKWRIAQVGDTALGKFQSDPDSRGGCRLRFY
jgi:hypothetical protein